MAEVLEPDLATAERAAAQAVETPGWTAPEDAGPQVGASRGRGGCGPARAARCAGGPAAPTDLSKKYTF